MPNASLFFKSSGERPFTLIAEPEGAEFKMSPGDRVLMKMSGDAPQLELEVFIRGEDAGDVSISIWPDFGDYELWLEAGGKSTRIRNP